MDRKVTEEKRRALATRGSVCLVSVMSYIMIYVNFNIYIYIGTNCIKMF